MIEHIIGHERVQNILETTLTSQRLSHAYLFHGLEGIGKRTLAQQFANRLLMKGSKHSSDLIFKKMMEANHPDYWVLGQNEGSIKTEEVEDLRDFLRSKPLESAYKVVLIDQAHNLTEQAQNRLLKTLEEPPAYGILLLVTHKPSDLLPTIHSRVESLSMSPLSALQLVMVLERRGTASQEACMEAAGMASGSVKRGIEILEDPSHREMRRFIIDWFSDIMKGSALSAQRKLDKQELDKAKAAQMLTLLRLSLRDMVLIGQNAEKHCVLKHSQEELTRLSHIIQQRKLFLMLESVEAADKRLERLVQPSLVMDVLSHTLQEVNRG